MKKTFSLLIICMLIMTLAFSLAGCGSSKKSEMATQSPAAEPGMAAGMSYDSAPASEAKEEMKADRQMAEKPAAPEAVKGNDADSTALSVQDTNSNILGDRKVIFNSFLALEVEDFDTKFKMITSMVQNSGTGYLQSSNIRSTKVSSNPETYRKEGSIVIRVAQNKFQNVLSEIRNMGTVIDDRTNSEEVTDQYYDTKYRAQMFEAERDRVMEYLKKANDLNTMLQLERKLSEITYEIERLKGSLRKLDNLVEFSTITIELREKLPGDIAIKNGPKSYGERLLDALVDSFEDTIRALGDFVIGIIRLLPTLVILGILFLIAKPFILKLIKKNNIQS